MTPKEKAVTNYVREKHNQDECVGFIDGYEKCQQDMADKKYTEEDMYNCWQTAFTDAMNITKKDYKPIWYSDYINSLNKQD